MAMRTDYLTTDAESYEAYKAQYIRDLNQRVFKKEDAAGAAVDARSAAGAATDAPPHE